MMNRGNMGKEISTAPKSKKVKKMQVGGMARPMGGSVPAEMQRGRPGMVMPPRPGGPGMGRPGMPQAGMMEAMINRRTAGMKKGGAVKGYAKGGMASRGDGCCMKGKTKGTMK